MARVRAPISPTSLRFYKPKGMKWFQPENLVVRTWENVCGNWYYTRPCMSKQKPYSCLPHEKSTLNALLSQR